MLRVAHVAQPTTAGVARVVLQLAVHSPPDVHPVVICPSTGDLAAWCAAHGIEHRAFEVRRAPTIGDVRATARLRSLVADADVVHLHSSKAGALGRLGLACSPRRARVVFQPHAWSWNGAGRLSLVYSLLERLLLRRTDLIITVSHEEAAVGRSVLGSGARMQTIENGLDLAEFPVDGPMADRQTPPLIVCVGRLCRQKGQDRLIRLLADASHADTRLRLVGEGPDRDRLDRLAREIEVSDRVEFTGASDPRPHIRAADVVVMPSRWEGMALAMLEAMALQKCVVATTTEGSEVLSGCGVVVEPSSTEDGQVRALAAATAAVLADAEKRNVLGVAARERVLNHHDIRRQVEDHASVWRSVSGTSKVANSPTPSHRAARASYAPDRTNTSETPEPCARPDEKTGKDSL